MSSKSSSSSFASSSDVESSVSSGYSSDASSSGGSSSSGGGYYEMSITYSWDSVVDSLETGTLFLDGTVGVNYGSSDDYLEFSYVLNDEYVVVDIEGAYDDGFVAESTVLECIGGWYDTNSSSSPVIITVEYNGVTEEKIIYSGIAEGGGESVLANITVSDDGSFTLS